jgi:ubiquitin C-terminal hydrolase
LREWTQLQKTIENINPDIPSAVINPAPFIKTVHYVAVKKRREMFSGWGQNDMSEFLLFFMDAVHNAIKRPVSIKINGMPVSDTDNLAVQCYRFLQQSYAKEYSELIDLCYGVSVTQIRHPSTSKILSTKPEHFFIVDLPLAQVSPSSNEITIYDCMDAYCADETLDNENAWYNETTHQKEPAVLKNTMFWCFPKILVFTFNRFVPGFQKNNRLVRFPIENLTLAKYVKGYRPDSYTYDLFGVCNHYGSISGGHYTAFSREIDERGQKKQWMEYNDTQASEVQNVETNAAYCLFYRKRV